MNNFVDIFKDIYCLSVLYFYISMARDLRQAQLLNSSHVAVKNRLSSNPDDTKYLKKRFKWVTVIIPAHHLDDGVKPS